MVETEAELRDLIGGAPTPLVAGKLANRLNDLFRRYVAEPPFVCVATMRASVRRSASTGAQSSSATPSCWPTASSKARRRKLGIRRSSSARISGTAEHHVDPGMVPTTGDVFRAVSDPTLDVDEYERARAARYRRREGLC